MSKLACIQPYLFFNGRCEEAVKFYTQVLDAKVHLTMRYRESPDPAPPGMVPEGWGEKIMHTSFTVGSSLIMASDGCDAKPAFEGFSLSLTLPDAAAAKRAFNALSKGGQVKMPLTKTFWSPCFGMLTDQFGIGWMVTVPEETKFAKPTPAKAKQAKPARRKA